VIAATRVLPQFVFWHSRRLQIGAASLFGDYPDRHTFGYHMTHPVWHIHCNPMKTHRNFPSCKLLSDSNYSYRH
jgi:hypothetical protein